MKIFGKVLLSIVGIALALFLVLAGLTFGSRVLEWVGEGHPLTDPGIMFVGVTTMLVGLAGGVTVAVNWFRWIWLGYSWSSPEETRVDVGENV